LLRIGHALGDAVRTPFVLAISAKRVGKIKLTVINSVDRLRSDDINFES